MSKDNNGKLKGLITDSRQSLEKLIEGETSRTFQQQAAHLVFRFGAGIKELEELQKNTEVELGRISRLETGTRSAFFPNLGTFSTLTDPSGISMVGFLEQAGGPVYNRLVSCFRNLSLLATNLSVLITVLKGEDTHLSSITAAENSATAITNAIHAEVQETLGWEKLVATVYLLTKKEYRKMRNRYMGSSGQPEDQDSMEDGMLQALFGIKQKPQDQPMGSALALIDDNCMLTQFLQDVSDQSPRYYDKTVPKLVRGKVVGTTKTLKVLDDGEVEEFTDLLINSSNHRYVGYAQDPSSLLANLITPITNFHTSYRPVFVSILAVCKKTNIGVSVVKPADEILLNPAAVAQKHRRINFMSIRPSEEDIAPRSRMEREYSAARIKMLAHTKETIYALNNMDRYDPATQEYAAVRAKEIINFHRDMEDVIKSERQKQLAGNLRDDNEFYVGRPGNIGALEVEREPAPRITYEDVVGESFIKAKEHIEEVVKVASHPHVMRLSAPRGDIKSNIMLIGPYGCGKSEMGRAVAADPRIIGFNVATADLLTAYMHESVKNIKRMYDHAKEMRRKSRYTKPVGILLDEFDRLFSYGEGVHQAYDGSRMTGTIQEMMDGIVGYEGVFIVALTNIPKQVPEAILRRFKFVDVVGQLTQEERAKLFRQFLTRGLPVDEAVIQDDYMKWAESLDNAPGDVIGKVADEVHFKFMHDFAISGKLEKVERTLAKRLRDREITDRDRKYLKAALSGYGTVKAEDVTQAVDEILKQPQVKMQINKAKEVYRDAKDIMDGLSTVGQRGLGFGGTVSKKSDLWN